MKKIIISVLMMVFVVGVTIIFKQSKYDYLDDNPNTEYSAKTTRVDMNMQTTYPDFTHAAEKSVEAVVYVKVVKRMERNQDQMDIFEYFFGDGYTQRPREQTSSGSGVIISSDGYIVTNQHVVGGATEIEVTLKNNRKFKAELVGEDPATDIAILKIEAKNLPIIPMGDSDDLKLGEWVLAIGNPFGLTSTITAGIVSAKGRSIPSGDEFKIESFIQTDAVVNPGNSGGALVDINGDLVGINTAIFSQTGTYAGYSFAVPVNMVKKITDDIIEHGMVQRALMGISMLNITEEMIEEYNLPSINGVFIAEVTKQGAADIAGVEAEDVLLSINGENVNSGSEVQEKINNYSPGDKIEIIVLREGKEKKIKVELLGEQGKGYIAKDGRKLLFGAELQALSKEKADEIGIKEGVEVVSLEDGKMKASGIKEGFVITYVNNTPVSSPEDVIRILENARRSIMIEGVYDDGASHYFAIGL